MMRPTRVYLPALFFLLAGIVIASISGAVVASPSLEKQGVAVEKKYSYGDRISLSCQSIDLKSCVLETKIENRKRMLKIDLGKYGLTPDFERIRLYVLSGDGEEYSFRISVDCEDADMALVPQSNWSADCLAGFTIKEGKIDGFPYVQVFPITTQTLYRSIKVP